MGVESTHSIAEAKTIAEEVSRKYGCVMVVSGSTDFITDGENEVEIPFGSRIMSRVTGMGCTLTAVIAAFRAVLNDSFESAKVATTYFGLCGQLAETERKGLGDFRNVFINNLHEADLSKMNKFYQAKLGNLKTREYSDV